MQNRLKAPIKSERKQAWLARLSTEERNNARQFFQWMRQIPEGLEYTRNQYQLCLDHDISFEELEKLTEKDSAVILIPQQ